MVSDQKGLICYLLQKVGLDSLCWDLIVLLQRSTRAIKMFCWALHKIHGVNSVYSKVALTAPGPSIYEHRSFFSGWVETPQKWNPNAMLPTRLIYCCDGFDILMRILASTGQGYVSGNNILMGHQGIHFWCCFKWQASWHESNLVILSWSWSHEFLKT